MGNSDSGKPGARPGGNPQPARTTPGSSKPAPAPGSPSAARGTAGRVIHDERGNAVWDWVKDTARIAIDSTSRLLRRLEVPELKVEDTREQELRIETDRDGGGGYDPYGGSGGSSNRTPGGGSNSGARTGEGSGSRGAPTNTTSLRSGAAGMGNTGGGYDPYGKGITNSPPRKR